MHQDFILVTPETTEIPEGKCPGIDWGKFPQSVQTRHIACYGQSRIKVECCECHETHEYYIWSMAGHGAAKCKGCGAMISDRGLHTVPAKLYKAVDRARKLYHKKTT